MSRIKLLNIAAERERCIAAIDEADDLRETVVVAVLKEYLACLDDALTECQAPPPAAAPAGGSYMERRIDAAGRYVEQINIGPAEAPHTGWIAVVKTDRIGSAEVSFARYATSPSDALDLALADAAAWVQTQKDLR